MRISRVITDRRARSLFLRRTRLNALVTPRRKNDWAAATELLSFSRIRKPVGETSGRTRVSRDICVGILQPPTSIYVYMRDDARVHLRTSRLFVRARACVTVRRGRQTRWTNLSNIAVLPRYTCRAPVAVRRDPSAFCMKARHSLGIASLFLSIMQISSN